MSNHSIGLVLVVDDEADVRNYLRMALEDEGFEVECAENGAKAIELLSLRVPDLISLDLVMPGFSGARLYRELQKHPDWSKIPVLIVTGHARDDLGRTDFEELTMSGPGIYLEKPVKPASYISAVRKLIGLPEAVPSQSEAELLQNELRARMGTADLESLKKALEVLKGK